MKEKKEKRKKGWMDVWPWRHTIVIQAISEMEMGRMKFKVS
jgi:hypothetical protein